MITLCNQPIRIAPLIGRDYEGNAQWGEFRPYRGRIEPSNTVVYGANGVPITATAQIAVNQPTGGQPLPEQVVVEYLGHAPQASLQVQNLYDGLGRLKYTMVVV